MITPEQLGDQPAFPFPGIPTDGIQPPYLVPPNPGMSTRTFMAKDICAAIAGGAASDDGAMKGLADAAMETKMTQEQLIASLAVMQADVLLAELAKGADDA